MPDHLGLRSVADLQDAATRDYTATRHRQHRRRLADEVTAAGTKALQLAAAIRRSNTTGAHASVAFAHPVHNPVENHSGVIRPHLSMVSPEERRARIAHVHDHLRRGELICDCHKAWPR